MGKTPPFGADMNKATKQICDAIKGLPDGADIYAGDLDNPPVAVVESFTIKNLKALVAENESLKEQVNATHKLFKAIRFGTKLYVDGGMIIRTSKEVDGEWKSQPSGSKVPSWQIYTTVLEAFQALADGGNDDRS